jgi:Tfp pilus assembly protein PilW
MNVTSIQNAAATHGSRRAMTLMDLMIATMIATLLFAAVGTVAVFTARSFVAMGNYDDLDRASRNALDTLSRDVRQSRSLTEHTPTRISLVANDNSTLTYNYNPSTRNFTRHNGGAPTVLLSQCDYLNFKIYQRNPSNNWSWYPVASNQLSTAKLIDVSWRCSRKILGEKVNTESVQTAKIVIRN